MENENGKENARRNKYTRHERSKKKTVRETEKENKLIYAI